MTTLPLPRKMCDSAVFACAKCGGGITYINAGERGILLECQQCGHQTTLEAMDGLVARDDVVNLTYVRPDTPRVGPGLARLMKSQQFNERMADRVVETWPAEIPDEARVLANSLAHISNENAHLVNDNGHLLLACESDIGTYWQREQIVYTAYAPGAATFATTLLVEYIADL